MKIFFPLYLFLFTAACSGPAEQTAAVWPEGKWIDLTYDFDEHTIYWPTADKFRLDTVSEGMTDKGYYYSAFAFSTAEHGGTHLDAPVHFAEGQRSVEEIPIGQLAGPAVVVDVSERALPDPDYRVGIADFESWEAANGRLPDGCIVLLRTGYGRYWPDPEKYMGTAERGAEAVAKLHFPGLIRLPPNGWSTSGKSMLSGLIRQASTTANPNCLRRTRSFSRPISQPLKM